LGKADQRCVTPPNDGPVILLFISLLWQDAQLFLKSVFPMPCIKEAAGSLTPHHPIVSQAKSFSSFSFSDKKTVEQ
jgi:hypothetical protein